MEKLPKKWKPPNGADWTEMRKEEKRLKCTLLNGSAWSTEKKCMRRYEAKCDIFFEIEHRLRKEKMEDSSTKRPRKDGGLQRVQQEFLRKRQAMRIAKHTSGGVFVASDSNLGAVVGAEEGVIESFSGNEGRIAQAWVNVRGGLRISRCTSGIRKDGRPGTKPSWKRC